MSDMFRVTPEELERHSRYMKSKTEEYQSMYNNLYKDVDTMRGTWQGEANQAFTNQINGYKRNFAELAEILNLYAGLLNTAKAQYSQTEGNLVAKAKQL